jgi:F0F1-type ATP synthase membrane subunit b/b'
MSSIATVLLLGSLAVATCTRSISHLRRGKQLGKMNPEAVAHTLAAVEGNWLTEAVAFAECNTTDTACQEDTMKEYKKSCQTVVGAIIQSSNGDKSVVTEYLGDICEQPELHSWKREFCNNFATALTGVLTDDSYVNRDDLAVDTTCANFLTHGFLKQAAKDEVARAEKERQEAIAAQEAEAKKEAQEKAEAEAAEAKEHEAAAKAEAAKAAAQVAAKLREEAQAKADEAAQRTAEAANATQAQQSVEVNSTASPATVNSTSETPAISAVADANSTTVPEVPAQTNAEITVNGTIASTTANSTSADAPTNGTKL